jgi:PadR family transcriptional regulator, regulatory protein PadR
VTDHNRQARYYKITASGRRKLGQEVENWKKFVATLESVLKTT